MEEVNQLARDIASTKVLIDAVDLAMLSLLDAAEEDSPFMEMAKKLHEMGWKKEEKL